MRKLFLVAFIVVSTFSMALSQQSMLAQNVRNIPNMGRAPQGPDGVGRVDARIFDQEGNPVKGAKLYLKSKRSGGRLCESWNWSNEQGQALLPPLHMGRTLKLTIEAPGYAKQTINLDGSRLGEPLVITLTRAS